MTERSRAGACNPASRDAKGPRARPSWAAPETASSALEVVAVATMRAAPGSISPDASYTTSPPAGPGGGGRPVDAVGQGPPSRSASAAASAAADPTNAAGAYFNIGAVYTNAGRPDDANAAFDKCLAADPNRAEAYYQKGVNLLGKATLQGNKTIPAPGTVEALQKYLELAPTGPNAQSAKDLLTSLGSSVETSYGNKKKSK